MTAEEIELKLVSSCTQWLCQHQTCCSINDVHTIMLYGEIQDEDSLRWDGDVLEYSSFKFKNIVITKFKCVTHYQYSTTNTAHDRRRFQNGKIQVSLVRQSSVSQCIQVNRNTYQLAPIVLMTDVGNNGRHETLRPWIREQMQELFPSASARTTNSATV